MQSALKKKSDIKLFILYLIKNIGYPLDFATLNDIVTLDGIINYFDFAESFSELLDTGNIKELKNEDKDLYFITEQGLHVIDNLQSNLLSSIREKALKSALRLLSFRKSGAVINYSSKETDDGKFIFSCSINDGTCELLSLNLTLNTKEQLDKITYKFSQKPEDLYKGILALLSGESNYLFS